MDRHSQPLDFRHLDHDHGGRFFGITAYHPNDTVIADGSPMYNTSLPPTKPLNDDYYYDNKAFEPQGHLYGKEDDGVSVSVFPTKSQITTEKKVAQQPPKKRICAGKCKYIVTLVVVVLIIIVIVVVAYVLLKKSSSKPAMSQTCVLSQEAKSKGLLTLLDKVEKVFVKYHPGFAVFNPATTPEQLWQYFSAPKIRPAEIKETTDASLKLLAELEELWNSMDMNKLKTRERKAMYEAKEYFLRTFGFIFEANYYSGDWMLEPNIFCWQPTCYTVSMLFYAIPSMVLNNLTQVELLISIIKQHNASIYQHIENMRLGVRSGMVRPIEACTAGYLSYRSAFKDIAIKKEEGILDIMKTSALLKPSFLEKITPEMHREFERKHGENITNSFKRNLVENVGKPIAAVLRYLESEHLRHCPPSSVSSGFATLPLKYVYVNGNPDLSRPTTQRLPTGELLNGKQAYLNIARALVSRAVTSEELLRIGEEQLNMFYAEAVNLTKEVTKETDEAQAISKFKRLMVERSMFYNAEPFPTNESDRNAFLMCAENDGAKRYCPKRWAAFQKYSEGVTKVENDIKPRMSKLFFTSGPKMTTPVCGISNFPLYLPMASFRSYVASSSPTCEPSSYQTMPFFMDNYGPKFSDYSLTAHEYLPGHHLEVRGAIEHFLDKCGDSIAWMNDETFFSGFSEGWAMYAEHPLMDKDLNMYEGEPLRRYGMLQQMIMASLRLVIESGLHLRGMTRSEALQLFTNYTWDSGDQARKEITRYQSGMGQSITYMMGRTDILKARAKAERELGSQFSLKDFHYELLRQGDMPLEYMKLHIDRYIECKKHGKENGDCDVTEIRGKT